MLIGLKHIDFLKSVRRDWNKNNVDSIVSYFEKFKDFGYTEKDFVLLTPSLRDKLFDVLSKFKKSDIPYCFSNSFNNQLKFANDFDLSFNTYVFFDVPVNIILYNRFKRKYNLSTVNFSKFLSAYLDAFFVNLKNLSRFDIFSQEKFLEIFFTGSFTTQTYIYNLLPVINVPLKVRYFFYKEADSYMSIVLLVVALINFTTFSSLLFSASSDELFVAFTEYLKDIEKKIT